jgi:hypothetical protein
MVSDAFWRRLAPGGHADGVSEWSLSSSADPCGSGREIGHVLTKSFELDDHGMYFGCSTDA